MGQGLVSIKPTCCRFSSVRHEEGGERGVGGGNAKRRRNKKLERGETR